jgi:flagellar biosynthesis/type III secretory pathway M-ring protein FliF/YscJ
MDNMGQLKDIKSIVYVVDYSLSYLLILIFIVCFIVLVVLYKYFTKIRKTKQLTDKQIALKKLQSINYENIKELVYTFSVDGYLFVTDKNKDEFNTIEKQLEQYKYKKEIPELPKEIEEKITKFIKGLK